MKAKQIKNTAEKTIVMIGNVPHVVGDVTKAWGRTYMGNPSGHGDDYQDGGDYRSAAPITAPDGDYPVAIPEFAGSDYHEVAKGWTQSSIGGIIGPIK